MMKNKPIETQRDLYQFIERIEKNFSPSKKILFPSKRYGNEILYLNNVLKKDLRTHHEIRKRHIIISQISIILLNFLFWLSLFLIVFFGYHSDFHLRGTIKYGLLGRIKDCIYFPCIAIMIISFITGLSLLPRIAAMKVEFQSFLYWYKEHIKKRPEWEINKIIQEVRIPKYKIILTKIFCVWMVYVKK